MNKYKINEIKIKMYFRITNHYTFSSRVLRSPANDCAL